MRSEEIDVKTNIFFAVLYFILIGVLITGIYKASTNQKQSIFTDTNGCEYLVDECGKTPRNNPNGTQICNIVR